MTSIYNKDLKNDSVKMQIIQEYYGNNKSSYEISRELGIPARTIQNFLAKDTHRGWHLENEEIIDKYFSGFGYEAPKEDTFVGIGNAQTMQRVVDKVKHLENIAKAKKFYDTTRGALVNGDKMIRIPSQYLEEDASAEDAEVLNIFLKCMEGLSKNEENGLLNQYGFPIPEDQWEGLGFSIKKKEVEDKPLKICIVADTQAKPNVSLEYMKWIGKYIFDKKPDVVVHIGDAYDFESLSSYDKGKKSFEGRRLKADIEAGNESMKLLLAEFQKDGYNPRLVFCMGNHEARFDRLADEMPELDGFVGTGTLPLAEMGWEVQPFLKPINIEGIFFVHYLANPMTGKPYGGTAMNQLKTVGNSFVVGHKQCLDVAIRPTLDGKHQIGIINGAAYDFEEPYKGYTGNNHFRGITMLHEVKDGFGLPMFISLDYLKKRYED